MKHNKRIFNQLLLKYNKSKRRLTNLQKADRNHRRQSILQKSIERLYKKLMALKMSFKLTTATAALALGALAFAPQTSQAQIFAPVQTNSFSLTNIGIFSAPTFADLDGDGDMDLMSGDNGGNFQYFENTGTTAAPVFGTVQTNPFSLTNIGLYSSSSFVDLDGDGDIDLMSGDLYGNFFYFENTGTSAAPVFGAVQTNPFSLTDIGSFSNPSFADLDGDGDMDLMAGYNYGNFFYFENTGTTAAPVFGPVQTNPFSLTNIGIFSHPSFADLDSDGDLDLMSGEYYGDFKYFENTGTTTTPVFGAVQTNPFTLTNIGYLTAPTFADLDSDGDLDLMSGDLNGNFFYFENISCIATSGTDIQVACNTYTWPLNSTTYTSSTTSPTFNIVGGNANGCDSLVTLNLTINSSTAGTDTQVACNTYTWPLNSTTYTSSTTSPTFNIVGGNANGCDSLVTLNLTINSSTAGTDTQVACNTYTWPLNSTTYTSSTTTPTFNIVGGNANGCDSLVTLNLTINSSTAGTDTQVACNTYTWPLNSTTYTSSTTTPTFNMVGAAANGCDSLVTLNLTINTVDTSTTNSGAMLSANAIGATYQWIDCDNSNMPISGATNQSYTATSNGNFAVVVTENGCTDTSSCINVTGVGIDELNKKQTINVYPNPMNNMFTVKLNEFDEITELHILSVEGKVVYSNTSIKQNNINIDAANWSKGVYYVKVTNSNSNFVTKLIKQ